MKYMTRHRHLFLIGGAIIALIASLLSDPDRGISTALGGLALIQGVWAVALAFWARKALMDYPEADQRLLFSRASEHPIGAGLALISAAIVFLALVLVFSPRAHAAQWTNGDGHASGGKLVCGKGTPSGYCIYGGMLATEQRHYWPDHPAPWLLAALVEQESCVNLKFKSCWNPSARLKSAREEGAGVGQITRVYRSDGSERFDALADMRREYGSDLAELSWDTIYQRPDLQFRALVLMSRDSARVFRAAPDVLAFGDAGYNGGAGGVQKERRACALTHGCNPGLWFVNVERHCLKSRQPLYGGRNACDINREHVVNVLRVRAEKYRLAQI